MSFSSIFLFNVLSIGQRSWGPLEPDAVVERNVQQRNSEITVLAMIETAEGLKNVKSICEVWT